MAGVGFAAVTAEVSTGSGATKTIAQVVAASNHALKIKKIEISFDGTSSTAEPIFVTVVRQSTAGTSSALTPVKAPNDDSDETLQVTAIHTATVEPTTGDIVAAFEVHPQLGKETVFAYGEEIKVGGGDRLGVRVLAAASVNCVVGIYGEE